MLQIKNTVIFKLKNLFLMNLAEELHSLKYQKGQVRHPLAYLVEAADDICYTIIDFEDGINLGWISEDYALEYLINLVRDQIDSKKYAQLMAQAPTIKLSKSFGNQ